MCMRQGHMFICFKTVDSHPEPEIDCTVAAQKYSLTCLSRLDSCQTGIHLPAESQLGHAAHCQCLSTVLYLTLGQVTHNMHATNK